MTKAAAPNLKIENWPINSVINYARNSRLHSDDQIKAIAASITEFGFINPCLVDDDGVLIAGHGRVMACKSLGIDKVPVIKLGHLDENQIKALRIADNQLPQLATWSIELLRAELLDLKAINYPIELIGFDDVQLVTFMAMPKGDDPERTPDPPAVPVSRLGDLWLLGKHRILCGDSTNAEDVERVLDGKKPHLCVTDPPYGVDYNPTWRDDAGGKFGDGKTKMRGIVQNDDRAGWKEAWDLFDGDVAYIWCASLTSDKAIIEIESSGLARRSQIIWRKPHFQLSRGDYHWQHEPCWYVVRPGRKSHWNGDRTQSTMWDIAGMNPAGRNRDAGNEKTEHGTQKPVECMRRPIQNNSKPGDYVYEPFAGSGTTIIAAEMMNRYCLAIELSPAYVDVIVRRWQEFAKGAATLDGDGRIFAEIAKERAKKKAPRKSPEASPKKRGRHAAGVPQ